MHTWWFTPLSTTVAHSPCSCQCVLQLLSKALWVIPWVSREVWARKDWVLIWKKQGRDACQWGNIWLEEKNLEEKVLSRATRQTCMHARAVFIGACQWMDVHSTCTWCMDIGHLHWCVCVVCASAFTSFVSKWKTILFEFWHTFFDLIWTTSNQFDLIISNFH